MRDLHRIGIEDIATHVLGAALPAPGGLHRRATWADHAERAGRASAHDDRRRCCSTYASATRSRPGHLRGALHIPLQDLPGRVHSLPHGELWVHCRSGYRAGIAASLIARTGRPVVQVDDDWANADPVVAPRGRAA